MNAVATDRALEILLVEDNPGDVRLFREGLLETRGRYHLRVARDGLEAVEVLKRQGTGAGAALPDVVLLDLNLPRKDGREVLMEIRRDPALHLVPVVVLTSSRDAADISRMYELGANAYVTKPVNLDDYVRMIGALAAFWFRTVQLPLRA